MTAPALYCPLIRAVNHERVPLSKVSGRARGELEHGPGTEIKALVSVPLTAHMLKPSLRLDRESRLDPVRGLHDDTKRRAAATAQREEQVLILALVRSAVHAVGCDNLDLHLAERRS